MTLRWNCRKKKVQFETEMPSQIAWLWQSTAWLFYTDCLRVLMLLPENCMTVWFMIFSHIYTPRKHMCSVFLLETLKLLFTMNIIELWICCLLWDTQNKFAHKARFPDNQQRLSSVIFFLYTQRRLLSSPPADIFPDLCYINSCSLAFAFILPVPASNLFRHNKRHHLAFRQRWRLEILSAEPWTIWVICF